MKKRTCLLLLACLLASGVSAQLPHLIFHAELAGAEQIPAVSTDARGLITLIYSPDRSKVTVTGLLVGMEGTVNSITLHIGKTGEVGAALVDLMPVLYGPRLYGEVEVPPALLQNLLPDRVYANVRTTAHPGGEIRGQFICETDLDYRRGIIHIQIAVSVEVEAGSGRCGAIEADGEVLFDIAHRSEGVQVPVAV